MAPTPDLTDYAQDACDGKQLCTPTNVEGEGDMRRFVRLLQVGSLYSKQQQQQRLVAPKRSLSKNHYGGTPKPLPLAQEC